MTFRKLSTTKREELYDHWRGDAQFPLCNLCSMPIHPGQDWDESHSKHKPRWLGGPVEGLAHRRCNRRHNNQYDTPLFHKSNRIRQKHIRAWRPRTQLPGGRDDPRKRTMAGEVVDRKTGERWSGRFGDRR